MKRHVSDLQLMDRHQIGFQMNEKKKNKQTGKQTKGQSKQGIRKMWEPGIDNINELLTFGVEQF